VTKRSFCLTAGIIFLVIALLHLLRIAFGGEAVIEGWTVPKWVSWVALVVAGYLGYEGLKLSQRQADRGKNRETRAAK
jgi:uncharacterized membrane protein